MDLMTNLESGFPRSSSSSKLNGGGGGSSNGNNDKPAEKKVLHAGKGPCIQDVPDGSKVHFHFMTKLCDGSNKILDDTRQWTQPMELVLGKKFQLPIWEICVRTMRVGEVASFTVKRSGTCNYPSVAKTLREAFHPQQKKNKKSPSSASNHTCSMMALSVAGGLGYYDLNELIKSPSPLEFIFELLKVDRPDEYEKESWLMNPEEKADSIDKLRLEGNALFKDKKHDEAMGKYSEAIGRLEQLIIREKPNDSDWEALRVKKVPLLLNYSQCKLYNKEYYAVIEHCSEVLEIDPNNVKALYRRGKAHAGAWNPKNAKSDFQNVAELDPTLSKTCAKEIQIIETLEKEKDEEDKKKLQSLF